MDTHRRDFDEASKITTDRLRTIAQSTAALKLSRLSLPEVKAVTEEIGRLIPAGNVPALILSGLLRLPDRIPPQKNVKRDIDLLLRGVEKSLDRAVYGTFFAGPAAVIWGYQSLLKLAGKNPDDAFPEGPWQFYVDYAMREDTAHHTSETHGFDTFLNQHQIALNTVDRITAWAMAVIHCLHQFDALLANEWRERVQTRLLAEITHNEPDSSRYARLYHGWEQQRPYGRDLVTTSNDTYPTYRRLKFDQFMAEAMGDLRADLRDVWAERFEKAQAKDLPAYQQQMSILAYLDPGTFDETRTSIPLEQAHICIIYRGCYYLIPACSPGTNRPAEMQTVRATIAALSDAPVMHSVPLTPFVEIKRSAWAYRRPKMNKPLIEELNKLRLAPILLNCDVRPHRLPLAELRRAERGIGDHALTIFDTGKTTVFDQSHIFFDGAWGVALAEILTQEAIFWANHLNALENPPSPNNKSLRPLTFNIQTAELEAVHEAPQVMPEASAEIDIIDVKAILKLRRHLKQRNELLQLTVNDILILYRAIHAAIYQPDPDLITELQNLKSETDASRQAASVALDAIERSKNDSPAIVMPVDVSPNSPRDRLHAITLDVPLNDLDLLNLHQEVTKALTSYKNARADQSSLYAEFDQLRRTYLATLAGFGELLRKAKEIAIAGESFSINTIKLLAHIPTPLQHVLEKIPGKIDMLNDLIRGREVFSNVGAVVPTSTLTRFITAKDDNEKKTLMWGVITDAQGVMRVSLRDFRPHVALLTAVGHKELAGRITQDYLETYGYGLNSFILDLKHITQTSHKSHLQKSERKHDEHFSGW